MAKSDGELRVKVRVNTDELSNALARIEKQLRQWVAAAELAMEEFNETIEQVQLTMEVIREEADEDTD